MSQQLLSPNTRLSASDTPQAIIKAISEGALKHVGIIMDGNRRWAREQGRFASKGHLQGYRALKTLIRYCSDIGLPCLTVYAFSTENWKRSPKEVLYLMALMHRVLSREIQELLEQNVKLVIIGDYSAFPKKISALYENAMRDSAHNTGLTLQVAVNYGGRDELQQAIQTLAQQVKQGELRPDEISEERISQALYTHQAPDPDLIIRTGGEFRLSNFLLWQSAYAEFWSTQALWPDFTPDLFNTALEDYLSRARRFGR
jgi:undecaprenyl diphosphate synthase